MAVYGSLDTIKQTLRAQPSSDFNDDDEDRMIELQAAMSRWVEQQTGRVFGVAPVSETLILAAPDMSPVLILPKAIRLIDSVVVGAMLDESGNWTGGTTLGVGEYAPIWPDAFGYATGLRRYTSQTVWTTDTYGVGSIWYGSVAVTGVWADAGPASVPDEITYLVNYLVAERWKADRASASGTIGANGDVIPIKNPFKDPYVLSTIQYWKVTTGPAF